MTLRHLISGGFALFVTFGLFWVMQALISMEGSGLGNAGPSYHIDFVRLKREENVNEKKRKIPEKTPPKEQPPPPPMDLSQSLRPDQGVDGMDLGIDLGLEMDSSASFVAAQGDSDTVPVVRVEPQYPLRAEERGIEGWVELEFTISAQGTVKDARVMRSKPSGVFDRSALRAVKKWKYNPKIEDGVAVERPGITVRLTFDLEDA
jgi:protein TonB